MKKFNKKSAENRPNMVFIRSGPVAHILRLSDYGGLKA